MLVATALRANWAARPACGLEPLPGRFFVVKMGLRELVLSHGGLSDGLFTSSRTLWCQLRNSLYDCSEVLGGIMKLAAIRNGLGSAISFIQGTQIPIVPELLTASWSNWRESFKEAFVTLFFSLMPLWLGLLIVKLLTIADGTTGFIAKFASSSDLGILSASLLGPMLYMMFREDNASEQRIIPRFPSGLWFIMSTVACCIVATVIYCFNYVHTRIRDRV
jgi:hypothetical protein